VTKTIREDEQLLTPKEAGRRLGGITSSAVIALSVKGQLPTLRDSANRRLFKPADVEALRQQREKRGRS
jgi:hypothetical protein